MSVGSVKQVEKTKPVYDKWFSSSADFGFVLRMYRTGGLTYQAKRFSPEKKKYESVTPVLVVPWAFVEAIWFRYHMLKALHDERIAAAKEG